MRAGLVFSVAWRRLCQLSVQYPPSRETVHLYPTPPLPWLPFLANSNLWRFGAFVAALRLMPCLSQLP